jgi:very-short-patch-repair endonuclease
MASHQGGLISFEQLRAYGLTKSSTRRLVCSGFLERVLPRVYNVTATGRSQVRALWAAHLYLGDGSAISHTTSAWRWGFDGFTSHPVHISTISKRNGSGASLRDGTQIVIHRVDEHLVPEIVQIDGLPVTSVRRTILELCGQKHRRAAKVIDAGLRDRLTTLGDLWLYLEQEWMRGRRGVRILRDLLVQRTPGRVPSDSELERDTRALIDSANLPAPRHQFAVDLDVATVHIDLAYPDAMLALEVDSYSWHLDREAFDRDRERDIELQSRGWTVYRLTWTMIRYQPDRVVGLIRDHLSRVSAR